MAKRFTDSDKWSDTWFRALSAEHKLAWLYLLDNCDTAGVIDLDKPLADFQIGTALDWDTFLANCSTRVTALKNGKLFVVRFVEFQYGKLSRDCRAHNPVFASLEKNEIENDRGSKGYSKGIQRGQDKDKDKDKDFKEKENECDFDDWIFPDGWDCPEARQALDAFAAMRRSIKKPIRSKESTSKIFKGFDDVQHLIFAAEFCEANEYQGLKPEYRPPKSKGVNGAPVTFEQQKIRNSEAAAEAFLAKEGF